MEKNLDNQDPSVCCKARRRKALTVADILEELLNDDEVDIVAAIPPEQFDGITDEEDIDDECLEVDEPLERDLAGTFEWETKKDREGLSCWEDDIPLIQLRRSNRIAVTDDDQPSTSTGSQIPEKEPENKYKLPSAFAPPVWKRVTENAELPFEIFNVPEPLEQLQFQLQENLMEKSPSEVFFNFFDDEMLQLIVTETKRYAMQKNDEQFALTFNVVLLKRFIGILILSGYNKLPQIECYWSTNPTLGSRIVQQTMSRSTFRKIKKYLHFQDNNNLDKTDKYTKVRNLFEIMNKKFMQFGVFEEHLSIDEQMLPYFGRHSCKMYLKSKPIKFGYKTWCMASSTGYVYRMQPYGGASDKYDKKLGLGASVVMDMVSQLEYPCRHQVFFDNFFTSYYLMCLLADNRVCATGTVRNNRLGKPAPDLKTGKQLPKGILHFFFCSQLQ